MLRTCIRFAASFIAAFVLALALISPQPVAGQDGYIGCFRDDGDPSGSSGRDLDSPEIGRGNDMTVDRCLGFCRSMGYAYAGAQFSEYCFCGNSYGSYGAADNCNMPCAGNPSEICGGEWANSVYAVGGGLFRSRWDKIGGPGGAWTTGWIPNHDRPVCGHRGAGCECGAGYCGEYPSGAVTYWWPSGCGGPRWTLECTSVPQ